MIPRYSRREMADIWSDEFKFKTWLEVELAVCEAWGKLGKIPKEDLKIILEKADFDIERIFEIEKETRHDVIAFLTAVAEKVGPSSRYIHMGMTSSDMLDTALALQLKRASEIIKKDLEDLIGAIRERALEHKNTPMMGRSHGIHAEPITFGFKMAVFYDEFKRNLARFINASRAVAVGKISGAVGTYANVPLKIEEKALKILGLGVPNIATQVIQRDIHAEYFTTLAIIASSIEKLAVEIRHLQRTEVLEVEESFKKGQKGSSAMPHKRNPVLTENLTGLARIVRSNSIAAMENVALWHERDISHSSVERIIGPDSTILIDFMLARMTNVIKELAVYPENMMKNIERTKGLIFSQQVLLALVETGVTREDAYKIVQRNAMKVWEYGEDFRELLKKDDEIGLSAEQIDAIFNLEYHLKHVDDIFSRVFS